MKNQEAMKLALEALENTTPTGFNMESDNRFYAAIKALEEALANHIPDATKMVSGVKDSLTTQQEQGEPVATPQAIYNKVCLGLAEAGCKLSEQQKMALALLVQNTTPQQPSTIVRTWFWLTEEEVREVWSNFNSGLDTAMNFYNAVETKLKEKNT